MRGIFAGLPWWVKWVAVPVIALVVFGGLIASVVGFVIGLLFKALIFVALAEGLVVFGFITALMILGKV